MDAYQLEQIYQLEQRKRLEILDLINSIQNKNNQFINITNDDLTKIFNHVKKHDLDTQETIQLLKDLAYV